MPQYSMRELLCSDVLLILYVVTQQCTNDPELLVPQSYKNMLNMEYTSLRKVYREMCK